MTDKKPEENKYDYDAKRRPGKELRSVQQWETKHESQTERGNGEGRLACSAELPPDQKVIEVKRTFGGEMSFVTYQMAR
jgi:hypothetical protein